MRIHIASDLHLSSGPYQFPTQLECDVVIAAGDIGSDLTGIELLKTIDKPVIYVLGNHEYYSQNASIDMGDRLDQIRKAAFNSNVFVLENESVIINGVRFLGTTLWTNFGDSHPGLLREALDTQFDYQYISAYRWFHDASHLSSFYESGRGIWTDEQLRQQPLSGKFHPLVGLHIHKKSLAWIEEQLHEEYAGHTVVVTHHHPSFESLRRSGVDPRLLDDKSLWYPQHLNDDIARYRVASYASDLDDFLRKNRNKISLWVSGHIHHHLDYMQHGVRIVCNPRGHAIKSLVNAAKGKYISADVGNGTLKEVNQSHESPNCYPGKAPGFDPSFIVDLNDGVRLNVKQEIEMVLPSLQELNGEIRELARHLGSKRNIASLAICEAIEARAQKFEQQFKTLINRVAQNILPERCDPHAAFMNGVGLDLPLVYENLRFESRTVPLHSALPNIDIIGLISAQRECLKLLPLISDIPSRLQSQALARLEELRNCFSNIQIPPHIHLPWRQVHSCLGKMTGIGNTQAEIEKFDHQVNQILNPEFATNNQRMFYVEMVEVIDLIED